MSETGRDSMDSGLLIILVGGYLVFATFPIQRFYIRSVTIQLGQSTAQDEDNEMNLRNYVNDALVSTQPATPLSNRHFWHVCHHKHLSLNCLVFQTSA